MSNRDELERPLLAPASPRHTADAAVPARHDNIALGMMWYGASSFFFAGMGI